MSLLVLDISGGSDTAPKLLTDTGTIGNGLALLGAGGGAGGGGELSLSLHDRSMQLFSDHMDEVADAFDRRRNRRADAFSPGMAQFDPEALTHRFEQVMEQPLPPLNVLRALPVNNEINPGADGYRQWRMFSSGKAVVFKGGTNGIPEVGFGNTSYFHPSVYFATKMSISWLDILREGMVGISSTNRKLTAMRRAHNEAINQFGIHGENSHGIWGLLNHPYVDKLVSAVTFTRDAGVTTPAQIHDAVVRYANYAEENSRQTFQPNRLLVSPRVYNMLNSTYYQDGSGDNLMKRILDSCDHITSVVKMHELQGTGPGGTDIMMFSRGGAGSSDSSAELMMVMPPSILPPETGGLATTTYMVSGMAGVRQSEVGHNLIVYVEYV